MIGMYIGIVLFLTAIWWCVFDIYCRVKEIERYLKDKEVRK